MMEIDNLYFIDTPIEIQDSYYNEILEKLNDLDIDKDHKIYLQFSSIFNIPGKFFFKCYINLKDNFLNQEPDFLIFFS